MQPSFWEGTFLQFCLWCLDLGKDFGSQKVDIQRFDFSTGDPIFFILGPFFMLDGLDSPNLAGSRLSSVREVPLGTPKGLAPFTYTVKL